MSTNVGEQFVAALASKDREALLGLLDPAVEFRALTPRRAWEADSAETFVDEILLGTWFDDGDRIDEVVAVGARYRVGYALGVTNPEGPHLVAQQAFYELDDGRITWLRIMCAGYQPVEAAPAND